MKPDTKISIFCDKCEKLENKIIEMTLKNFVSELDLKKELPKCCNFDSMPEKHQPNEEEDEEEPIANQIEYCVDCKVFYCKLCLIDHKKDNPSHQSYKSDGMKIDASCEIEECNSGEKMEFYCKECQCGLCATCKGKHDNTHHIFDSKEFLTQEDLTNYKEQIEYFKQLMKNNANLLNEFLDGLEKSISKCREYLKEKQEENENILRYFASLVNTLSSTVDISNFNIRKNLIINNFEEIFDSRQKDFDNLVKNEFKNLPIKLMTEVTKEVFLEAEYVIKEKEDYKDDNQYNNRLKIFGENFSALSSENCTMLIDDVETVFRMKFKDGTRGHHTVRIVMKPGKYIDSMKRMFHLCSSLTSLNLSNFYTKNVTTMKELFSSCSSLTTLNLTNFSTENVTDMRWMFFECTSLFALDVSSFDTSKVTNMEGMFSYCSALSALNLTNFNTNNVTNMHLMFSNCSALSSLDISSFDTINVSDMQGMFLKCASLNTLNILNLKTSKVISMENMFNECISLSELNLSSFDTSNVISMKAMFNLCTSLSNLHLGNFNTSRVINMTNMFSSCVCLTNLNLCSFDTANVNEIKSMFSDCTSLVDLNISKFDLKRVHSTEGMFANCIALTNLKLPNELSKVNGIQEELKSCPRLDEKLKVLLKNKKSWGK